MAVALTSMNNLGEVLNAQGKLADAEALHREDSHTMYVAQALDPYVL